ncbi:hypothetical protein H9Q70_009469 [Fusarium xylarioides]|nr:hypothetical protein H9Q70_009469 [Fusarium xylarioides]KAG5776807.1 hypothetical protein H9Q73_009522 [Fusarium xylarioides]KAG5816106.1 hypothetical protein H9Q74_011292 [Fusarium xylarioides]
MALRKIGEDYQFWDFGQTESTTTALETSIDFFSKTRSSEASTTSAVVETTATTLDAQTTATGESEPQTTTAATLDYQTTTDIITTTTGVESSTTATVAPTFSVLGGGGAVDGALLQDLDEEGHVVVFNHNYPLDYKPRMFIIEPSTSRVKNMDGGYYVCAYYQHTGTVAPAAIGGCTGTPGPNTASNYIKCRVVHDKLSCTVAQTVCTRDFFHPFNPLTPNEQIVYLASGTPDSLFATVDLIAQEA